MRIKIIRRARNTLLTALILLTFSNNILIAQSDAEWAALARMKRQWGNVEFLEHTMIFAPAGHVIVERPGPGAKVVKRITEAGVVNARIKTTVDGRDYYVSDWSWNRYLAGTQPNWVVVSEGVPTSGTQISDFWDLTYRQLKHDETGRNCAAAFDYLMKNRNDPAVVQLCSSRYLTDKDHQSRSAAIAILCESQKFSHDETFCREVVKQLLEYRKAKLGYWANQNRETPPPGWVERWLHTYYWGIGGSWVRFVVRNGSKYRSVIAENLGSNDALVKWIMVHALVRHDIIDEYMDRLDDEFFSVVFAYLRDDSQRYNALYSTRILVMLRPFSDNFVDLRMRRQLDDQEREILRLFKRDLTEPDVRKSFEVELGIGDMRSDLFYNRYGNDSYEYELELFRNLRPYTL